MRRISLDALGNGELLEKVNMAMMQIGANIMDPNTDASAKRKLTITLTFAPDEMRWFITTKTEVKHTLAPIRPGGTVLLVGKDLDTGKVEIAEYGNPHPQYQVVAEAQEE